MKIALCLIVRGSDSEALVLNRALESTAPFVDGIYITRTFKEGEKKNAAVANVAQEYKAHLSDFQWINDFAAARNYNFSQVPKDFDYIMWMDADDIWRGLDKLKKTLEQHKHSDGFGFDYLYEWDEFNLPTVVHRKTMVIKNDGCATWVGKIHEDLQPNRSVDISFIKGIDRIHITNDDRVKQSAKRNLEIANESAVKSIDPRDSWNLANAQFAVSDFENSKKSFEKFISESHSTDEIYLAHTRLSNVYKVLNKREECIRELQMAIGLDPTIPDAYFQLGAYYLDFGNAEKAGAYVLEGFSKKPKLDRMIVYNPRDYDFNPMMLLAKICYILNKPEDMLSMLQGCQKIYPDDKKIKDYIKDAKKEVKMLSKAKTILKKLQKMTDLKKIKVELDKLPEDLKSYPAICAFRNSKFVKKESSGRDLVIYCGNTMETWNPETFKTKMVGGSEEAVIHMARELCVLGWNVTVYNNCGHKAIEELVTVELVGAHPGKIGSMAKAIKVTYRPFWEWNYKDKQDAVILWRWAKPLDAEINCDKIFLDLHDVVSEGELTEKRLEKLTKIFVKSQFHRSLFPNTPDSKFVVVGNGVELNIDSSIKRDPYLLLNTSSPDRSMDVLPKLFKEVKKQVPQAKLKWAYGFEGFKNAHQGDQKKMQFMEDTIKEIKDAGIESLGRLSQEEVGKLYQEASILVYPAEFAEIDCLSIKKAQVAGAYVVATDFGALGENIYYGHKVHSKKTKDTWNRPYQYFFGLEGEKEQKEWVDAVVKELKNPTKGNHSFPQWTEVAKQWNNELCG